MAYDLSKLLVIGISSRALFDLREESRIYDTGGFQAFSDYQITHEDDFLSPGSAFALIKGLLNLNNGPAGRKIEVILMSQNHPNVCLRVFNSIEHHGLDITRAALTGGASLGPYLEAFRIGLFLSQSLADVQMAANQRIAAGLIYPPPAGHQGTLDQIRIAFDGDCVIFSDEAQRIYDTEGLKAFHRHEEENAAKALAAGPFAGLLRTLSEIQGSDPKKSPVRIALVTDRNRPAHERAIRTLRYWNVRVDEAFFLGGIAKAEILKAFGAHMFFDDKPEYCELAAEKVPTGRVLMPIAEAVVPELEQIELTVALENEINGDGEERFLLICKSYLKRQYPSDQSELQKWYRLETQTWPHERRSAFLSEFEASATGTPRGNQRMAAAPANLPGTKLIAFLDSLASKHRPR